MNINKTKCKQKTELIYFFLKNLYNLFRDDIMNTSYSLWEEKIISDNNLTPNTIGTLMKLQNYKENAYLTYYYGDIALTIIRNNLFLLRNKQYTNAEIFTLTKNKANYFKVFKNKNLTVDNLSEEDLTRINYDIVKYIKATLISKSNNEKYIAEMEKLAKGDFSSILNLHKAFKLIYKYSNIDLTLFQEELAKLDKFYEEKYQELEDTNEYLRIIARKWRERITSGD